MKRKIVIAAFSLIALGTNGLVLAYGGGSMGSGGAMLGQSGMMIVADDGSLLVSNMNLTGTTGNQGAPPTLSRSLIDLAPDGTERWSVSFTDGWPMMPATDGNLVVVVLVNDWFMGTGTGDGGYGGGMMGGTTMEVPQGGGADQVTVVGLDLATGQERWRTTLDGDMGAMVQFAPDGSQVYLSLMTMGTASGIGMGTMTQGQATGAGVLMSATIVALDRNGNQLWTYDAAGSGGMGGMTLKRRRP